MIVRKKFQRIAQAPPMEPPMPGVPPPDAGPPGAAPMGGPGAPPAAPAAPAMPPPSMATNPLINGPLSTISAVLYDDKITDLISNSNTAPEDLALKIWQDYGGSSRGDIIPGNVGERTDNMSTDPQSIEQEHAATENTKWKRLPENQTIGDITSLDSLTRLLSSIALKSSIHAPSQGGSGPPGPGGAGPPGPAASKINLLIRIAHDLDLLGYHKQADTILRKNA